MINATRCVRADVSGQVETKELQTDKFKWDKTTNQAIKTMILKHKKLFLIDSLGALLSAFLLGVVLVSFESTFGMPRKVLYFLSITACTFAIYSYMSYLLIKENWKPYLKIIAFANLLYCCLTIGLIFYLNQKLTTFGLIFFLSEVIVIITLVIIELKIAYDYIKNKI